MAGDGVELPYLGKGRNERARLLKKKKREKRQAMRKKEKKKGCNTVANISLKIDASGKGSQPCSSSHSAAKEERSLVETAKKNQGTNGGVKGTETQVSNSLINGGNRQGGVESKKQDRSRGRGIGKGGRIAGRHVTPRHQGGKKAKTWDHKARPQSQDANASTFEAGSRFAVQKKKKGRNHRRSRRSPMRPSSSSGQHRGREKGRAHQRVKPQQRKEKE